MTERYPILYRLAQMIALLFIMFAAVFPNLLTAVELPLAALLIILLGIPHGATDHLIFLHLHKIFIGGNRLIRFYAIYLLLMGVYSLIWWLLPTGALILFLLLSAYHFGQSNWNYVGFEYKLSEKITFFIWGNLVLLFPIFWHYDAAIPIIAEIIRKQPPALALSLRYTLCIGLMIGNIFLVIYLRLRQSIKPRQFREEIANLLLLCLMFVSTPLLLGFVIYFVFWHSIGSIADQIHFFKQRSRGYNWKSYMRQALPLSIIAMTGIGLLYAVQFYGNGMLGIGLLFIFIAIVTLPHMILMDLLYSETAPEVHHSTA